MNVLRCSVLHRQMNVLRSSVLQGFTVCCSVLHNFPKEISQNP